jgi:hypothetical protein
MREAWQAAELLEDIAKHADPSSALRGIFADLIKNSKKAPRLFGVLFDPEQRKCTVTYFFPVETVMEKIQGTPEDVLEWLKTGVETHRSVELVVNSVPCFAVSQQYVDPETFDEIYRLVVGKMFHLM